MKTKVITTIMIVLFLASIMAIVTPVSALAWYDFSWTRRRPVTIDNTLAPDDLFDYQVKIDVDYDSDMKADFSDLRFTDSDGVTLLPYWVESYIDSTSAKVWVKVPSIPGLGSTTIYMYYGNPVAASESNIKGTFILGDDFNDGILDTDLWIEGLGAYGYPGTPLPGGGVSEADGELYIRTELYPGEWWVQNRYVVSTSSFSTTGTAFDYKVRIILYTPKHPQHLNGLFILDRRLAPEPDGMLDPPPGFGYNLLSMGMMGSEESQWLPSWGLPYYGDTLLGVKQVNYVEYPPICDEPWTYGEGYAPLSIRLTDTQIVFVANGAEVYRGDNDFADFAASAYVYACAGGRGYYGPPFLSEAYFDDIRVRKYVEPEPTTSVGEEESLSARVLLEDLKDEIDALTKEDFKRPYQRWAGTLKLVLSFDVERVIDLVERGLYRQAIWTLGLTRRYIEWWIVDATAAKLIEKIDTIISILKTL